MESVNGRAECLKVIGEHPGFRIANNGLDTLGLPGDVCLATQRSELAAHLTGEIVQPGEVRLHRFKLALGFLFTPAMLQNARGLFNETPSVVGGGVQNTIELTLANNDVHFTAETAIAQQLLNIEQSNGFFVDGVFTGTIAKQGPRDGDLGVVNRQCPIRVIDGQHHFGATQRSF